MKTNYSKCLAETKKWEGGKVDHPKDPGGRTNQGITQKVYDAYRQRRGLDLQDVYEISATEVRAIYKDQYWDRVRGDKLPEGLDLAVFDYAVNSGVARSVKDLQRCLGVAVDGVIGEGTLDAINGANIGDLTARLCDRRMAFLRALKTFRTFGNGWTRRVQGIRSVALTMADGYKVNEVLDYISAPAKAESRSISISKTAEGTGLSATGIGGMGQGLMASAESVKPDFIDTPVGRLMFFAFLGMMALGIGLLAFSYWKKAKEAGGVGNLLGEIFN